MAKSDKDSKTMMKFKLLSGVHGQFEETDEQDADGNPIRVHRHYAAGTKQDIVPNENNLVEMFGKQRFMRVADDTEVMPSLPAQAEIPGQTRHIPDTTGRRAELAKKAEVGTPPPDSPRTPQETAEAIKGQQDAGKTDDKPTKLHKAELDAMTVEDLREHARTNDINLHGASTKDDIVAAIRRNK